MKLPSGVLRCPSGWRLSVAFGPGPGSVWSPTKVSWPAVVDVLTAAGFRTETPYPHWLAKAHHADAQHFIDVIFGSGNGAVRVRNTSGRDRLSFPLEQFWVPTS